MSYKLQFHKKALKEWKKLDSSIKEQFKKKLVKRLEEPHAPHDKLSGYDNVYKIKLRTAGYRLAYEVIDDKVIVYVLAVGIRDKSRVYEMMKARFEDGQEE
ncbi:type II toxin-antitoxin system RelE/ParE family toxin [bacterium]|nr:type II toxin-antitoxin system RelE/ParE family toxin [bacterium]MBU1957139.1 type II toxin-antitoxin system RelE/ParE family toxin [bacterium]